MYAVVNSPRGAGINEAIVEAVVLRIRVENTNSWDTKASDCVDCLSISSHTRKDFSCNSLQYVQTAVALILTLGIAYPSWKRRCVYSDEFENRLGRGPGKGLSLKCDL